MKPKFFFNEKTVSLIEYFFIILFSIIPLFMNSPFKINTYLSYEGAYRMYLGHVPYQDFGLPMGFGMWVIPSFFFHIFGPFMASLIKAQVFINIISLICLREIFKIFQVHPVFRCTSIFVFCISYVVVNQWPWYNHSVFVFQLVSIYFLLLAIYKFDRGKSIIFLFLSAFFTFLSFYTKQDGGAFALLINIAFLTYIIITRRQFKYLLVFLSFYLLSAALLFVPFLKYDILYWFNYGQAPHYSRVNAADFIIEYLGVNSMEKFFLVIIILILLNKIINDRDFWKDEKFILYSIFSVGILIQAFFIKVTSYIPNYVNAYYLAIVIAFMLDTVKWRINKYAFYVLPLLLSLIFFWRSAEYWKYAQGKVFSLLNISVTQDFEKVSKYTWKIGDDDDFRPADKSKWKLSPYKGFKQVKMPVETIEGIRKIKELDIVKNKEIKFLNMSELTPLYYELQIAPEKGIPLWYHKNVAMFDKEVSFFRERIEDQYYDMVLFENISYTNNFYPLEVRESLQQHYNKEFEFEAPRDIAGSTIEVYLKK